MARQSQRVRIPTEDGLSLSGILEIPDRERLGTILFSHCFTCSKDLKSIVRISRELAMRGWIVLRYDFRGLGNSDGTFSKSNFTTNRLDLKAACRFLDSEYDGTNYLLGHSFGGAASLAVADDIESVLGVIALAAPSDTYHLADLLEKMDPAIKTQGCGLVTIGGFQYAIERQMVDDFRSYDLADRVRRLKKPLLTLHSPTDETVVFEHALRNSDFANARTNASTSRSLVSLPGCNHLLTDESHCRLVSWIIHGWCRGIAGESLASSCHG